MSAAKSVLLILADGFEEIEAATPIDVLRRAGLKVTVAGLGKTVIESARGMKVSADILLKDFQGLPDALVLPGGGQGAENLAASPEVRSLVRQMNEQRRSIAAICASPALVLSPAGVLDGRRVTGYPGTEKQMDPKSQYTGKRVVTDGHITTSLGPGSAMEFSLEIVRLLCGEAAVKDLNEKMVVTT